MNQVLIKKPLQRIVINDAIHSTVNMYMFDGNVLGDGTILNPDRKRKNSYLFTFYNKHKSYLEWLSTRLIILKERPIWNKSYLDSRTNKWYSCYWMRSLSSPFLSAQYQRWYPNGVKLIPDDINVNSDFLLHFFLDDGSRASNGAYYFALDAQPIDRVEFLRAKIEAYTGFPTSIHRNGKGYRLYIPRRFDFLGLIGDCPVKEYEYKWIQ